MFFYIDALAGNHGQRERGTKDLSTTFAKGTVNSQHFENLSQ